MPLQFLYCLLALIIPILAVPYDLFAQNKTVRAESASIYTCHTPPAASWSAVEKWAWTDRLCKGDIVDVSGYPDPDCAPAPPPTKPGWPQCRTLSRQFLADILFGSPWHDAIKNLIIVIKNANFSDEISFNGVIIDNSLVILNSRFEKNVDFGGSRYHGSLFWLNKTVVVGNLSINNTIFDGQISIQDAEIYNVTGFGAEIRSFISLEGTKVIESVYLQTMRVGTHAIFNRSNIHKTLNLNSSEIGGCVFFREGARVQDADFVSARIAKNAEFDGSHIEGSLDVSRAEIGGGLFVGRKANVKGSSLRLVGR